MAPGGTPSEVGIVLYPGAQMAAVHGLTDLFGIASRLAADACPDKPSPIRVTHWSPTPLGRDVRCVYRSESRAVPQPRILILPPTLSSLPDPETCAGLARWLRHRHAQGARLVTVCSGVFLVAGTGLLDGRTVATHRGCARALMETFPRIAVDFEARVIDHFDVLTAGGFMAWVDVGLMLVERLLGDDVRAETARFVRFDPQAGEAAHFSGFAPRQDHGDVAVHKAQEAVHLRDGQGVTLAELSAAAGLERRTFLRRFAAATGMTPMDYCQAVRLARAREFLESGRMPLKRIAETLGYVDQSSFSRAFRRAHGVPPGTYRQRSIGSFTG